MSEGKDGSGTNIGNDRKWLGVGDVGRRVQGSVGDRFDGNGEESENHDPLGHEGETLYGKSL